MSCHIDELRPSDDNAITLEVAQEVTISQLFYGGTEPETRPPERQTSEPLVSMAYERLTSTEEVMDDEPMEEGGEGEGVIVRNRTQEDGEIIDIENESDSEPMESGVNNEKDLIEPPSISEGPPDSDNLPSIYHPVQPASAALLKTKTFSDVYTQCVRLNSCIQAAASRLQDSTLNRQRATERVRLLIQVIPRKPTFPLSMFPGVARMV